MDKLQAWLNYKEPQISYHQQRTLNVIRKCMIEDHEKQEKARCEKSMKNYAQIKR